ncbi:minor capsid protein [Paenibacillus planticolens]|uniref:Phage head morphogenesis protein n=1 Tax=Paenibacillus planticolens TaxID=2654976 RepID=A0ABX1ZRB5_9BACL|nr:minor capsid protein [Paenibacillus planticolens]NOV01354.1 phage head morphogenesis protein [Paenibacillus planticolens]
MNKAERFIKKYLDESEERLLIRYDRWLNTVLSHIPIGASEMEIHQFHLPQPAQLSSILYQHAAEMLTAGQAHGDAEAKAIRDKRRVKLADLPIIDGNREFTPEEAMAILKNRELKLAGVVEADLVTLIKQVLLEHLTGAAPQSTKGSIAALLDQNKSRASLIVTTETTYAYNRGRLISYRENKVDYVRFSAIMDARTSAVCASRNGKVMRMDDPALGDNTPPLHGRCRSVLTPIYSRYEPDVIEKANKDWGDVAPLPKGWKTK